jgi:ribosomal protein L37AE/L43A
MNEDRMHRSYEMAENCEIKQISKNVWSVPSQSGNGSYDVTKLDGTVSCACKDFVYRSQNVGACKHCFALDYFLQLQTKILRDVEEQIEESAPEEITLCPDCKSPSIINYGKRVLKQILSCKDCGRQFRKQEEAFAKLQSDPRMISLILSMHCRNVSLRYPQ